MVALLRHWRGNCSLPSIFALKFAFGVVVAVSVCSWSPLGSSGVAKVFVKLNVKLNSGWALLGVVGEATSGALEMLLFPSAHLSRFAYGFSEGTPEHECHVFSPRVSWAVVRQLEML